jgi:hypothetical protein
LFIIPIYNVYYTYYVLSEQYLVCWLFVHCTNLQCVQYILCAKCTIPSLLAICSLYHLQCVLYILCAKCTISSLLAVCSLNWFTMCSVYYTYHVQSVQYLVCWPSVHCTGQQCVHCSLYLSTMCTIHIMS